MATNVEITTADRYAVVYREDGSQMIIAPGQTQVIDMVANSFSVIGDATGEIGNPTPTALEFAQRMVSFWQQQAMAAGAPP